MPRQQQQAYAELEQQTHAQPAAQEWRARPASPATHGRPAAAVIEGAGGAAPARGRAGRLPGASAGTTQRPSSPGKPASASALTSQKPTRIPMHAGGSLPQPPAAAAEQPAARAEQPAAPPAAPSSAAAAAAATPAGVGCTAASASSNLLAAANGSLGGASTSASATHQAALAGPLRSAPLPDSSDWSQDSSSSSTSSSDGSATSGPSKHSTSQHGSKAPPSRGSLNGDVSAEQCSASANGSHHHQQQQHSSSHGNGLQDVQQPGSCAPDPRPDHKQQQQQAAAGEQSCQQQEQLRQQGRQHQQLGDRQRLRQQLQDGLANGGPGPPAVHAGQAVAAAGDPALSSLHGSGPGAATAATAAAAAASDSDMVRARMSADPDYELPQGKLTETQVLLAHGSKLRLDRYGFILGESDIAGRTAGAAAAAAGPKQQRSASQVQREQRRVAKWRHMLGSSSSDFEAYCRERMKKVKRRVRKGIPDEFRGYAWQLLSGGHALMQSHPGMYARLVSHSPDTVDLEIMRDLNRTFPNHVFFHQRQGPGQQSLFHVLRAYSALDKQVGYVQGMGFVSAILLMYMSEEAAFWTLVALLKGTAEQPPLEGLYQAGMPLLQQCLYQFHELLKEQHPRLGLHLEQEGVVPSMYCTHWFNTLFAYSLPFEQLLRVWDVFLLEGMKVVFRVGIALLASAQDQLVAMPFERLVASLNGRKFPILKKHPDALIKAAMRIPVSKQLEQLRERFLTLQAETEAAAAAAASVGGASAAAGGSGAAGGVGSVKRSGQSSKHSAAHAQQQLIAGFAPVPMGPDS